MLYRGGGGGYTVSCYNTLVLLYLCHWYRQCSRLLILHGPSQHDSVVVITPIVSKVCTRDWRHVSPLLRAMWFIGMSVRENLMTVLYRVYSISYFKTCHGGSPGNASIFFCLWRRCHWYRQCSGLPILCGASQRNRRFVATPINWKVCTHNCPSVSPHHKELWGSFPWVLEKTWPCCIGCTLYCILVPVTKVSLVTPVFFFCLPCRRHRYRQCSWLPILHGSSQHDCSIVTTHIHFEILHW